MSRNIYFSEHRKKKMSNSHFIFVIEKIKMLTQHYFFPTP